MDHAAGTAPSRERFFALDALRAFALLLGVVFHAAESFCPGRFSWAIVDPRAHWSFDMFQHASHSFRMEIFYLMAGFFARLLYHRRGEAAFLKNRLRRIAVPFLAGWFVLYPLFVFLWLWGASVSGRLDSLGIPPEFHHLPVWKISLGALTTPEFYRDHFNLLHLWFLYQLLAIYALTLLVQVGVRFWNRRRDGRPILSAASGDRLVRRLLKSRFRLVWLALLSLPLLLVMDGWGVDTPNESLIPHLPTTLLYGGCFLLGWMLHRQVDLLHALAKHWILPLVIALALVPATKFLGGTLFRAEPAAWHKPVYCWFYGLMMWGFVLGISGGFLAWANRPSPSWRYVADSSYWIYLVHHLVLVPLQILAAQIAWPAGMKFLLINLVAFPVLFLSYHFLVRPTWIGEWLNGRRYQIFETKCRLAG